MREKSALPSILMLHCELWLVVGDEALVQGSDGEMAAVPLPGAADRRGASPRAVLVCLGRAVGRAELYPREAWRGAPTVVLRSSSCGPLPAGAGADASREAAVASIRLRAAAEGQALRWAWRRRLEYGDGRPSGWQQALRAGERLVAPPSGVVLPLRVPSALPEGFPPSLREGATRPLRKHSSARAGWL